MGCRRASAALLATVALLLLPPSLHAGAAGSPDDAIARFIDENVGLTSRPLSLDELRRRVQAQRERAREVPSVHVPGQIDKVVELGGKGIEVEIYVPASGPLLVQRIRVTAPERKLPLGMRIGRSTLDNLYKVLGAGEDAKGPDGEFARRVVKLEGTASAMFWVGRDERLAGVEWHFDGD